MADNYQFKTEAKKTAETSTEVAERLLDINRELAEEKFQQHATELKMPYVNIRLYPVNQDLFRKVNLDEAEHALALPFFILGKKMRIAVTDPTAPETVRYLNQLKDGNYLVQINLASEAGIRDKIASLRALQPKEYEEFANLDAETDLKNYEEEIRRLNSLLTEIHTISAQAALNQVFIGALRTGSSDIHFQPDERKLLIRFRIDGVLQNILEFEKKDGKGLTDQLKYEARLRINVDNTPQDGRTSFLAGDRKINVRVSTLPTEFGESIVCRLLDSNKKLLSLEQLGFMGSNLDKINTALQLRSGMLLVTGPTGSGKTTTLYTMIDKLNTGERKITTLENPIEYQIKNVVQSQIDEEQGYTFANGLRALLRQDPDVLMVGEIRDHDTAETAAQAALTGHIVFSTLHTNSAIEAIPRLLNLQMQPYILISSLSLVLAQRLVRKPCLHCATKTSLTLRQKNAFNRYLAPVRRIKAANGIKTPEFLWEIHGCAVCGHTGYHGQLAIAETFRMTPELGELILSGASVSKLIQHVRSAQGMATFAEDGLLKVCQELTTLEEVARASGTLFKL